MISRVRIIEELNEIFDELGFIENRGSGSRINFKELDSIQIISAIVEIEELFDIEIPDEYLVAEFFEDENHIADIVAEILEKQEESTKLDINRTV